MLLIISLLFPLFSVVGTYAAYFEGKQEFERLTKRQGIFDLCITVALVAVSFFTKTVFPLIGAFLIVSIVVNGTYLLQILKQLKKTVIDEHSIAFGKRASLV